MREFLDSIDGTRKVIAVSLTGLLTSRDRRTIIARGVVCALALTLLAAPPSFAGERALEEAPPPSSIEKIKSPLERAYPAPEIRPSLFPWISEKFETLTPFLADTQLYVRSRTQYMRQDRASGRLSEAWAMGGSVYYRSGWLKDLFAVELEGFTSQPLVAPARREGTRLLAEPGQDGYGVLGVANGVLRYRDLVLKVFRQKLDLPYLNQQDNRMTPNTFEAAKFAKDVGDLRFSAGYAWQFKPRNDDGFTTLSHQLGVSQDRGAAFGSALWHVSEDFHVGASGFVVPDVLATVYAETHYEWSLTDQVGLRVDAQFTHQHTPGKELIAGPSFDTWNVGLRTAASWRGAPRLRAIVVARVTIGHCITLRYPVIGKIQISVFSPISPLQEPTIPVLRQRKLDMIDDGR